MRRMLDLFKGVVIMVLVWAVDKWYWRSRK